MHKALMAVVLLISIHPLMACSSIYYNFWEKLGVEKRDLLKRDIAHAQDAQKESQEVFVSALDRIQQIYGLEGGELEQAYRGLSRDYEKAESKAKELRSRISSIEEIAQDLFEEWRSEAKSMRNSQMKRQSLARLQETEERFKNMRSAMKMAESSMEPVLQTMRDQVLFLKHNLNAMALNSFKKEFTNIEGDIKKLIRDMNRSIQQSESFLQTLNS